MESKPSDSVQIKGRKGEDMDRPREGHVKRKAEIGVTHTISQETWIVNNHQKPKA